MLQLTLLDTKLKIKYGVMVVYGFAHAEYKVEFLTELADFSMLWSFLILLGVILTFLDM